MLSKFILALMALATTTFAADCTDIRYGFANGECVIGYQNGCFGGEAFAYKPTCEGNCYQFPFNGMEADGDGVYGTAITAYSDDNCQNEIGTVGNTIEYGCLTQVGGSHKSYYRC